MQHLEDIRSIIIKLGFAVAALSYLYILGKAFGRGALWGILALFCPPIGGWLHCLTAWWEMSKMFIVHFIAIAALAYGLFFFPRVPLYGHWTDASGNIVYNFQENGVLRDYTMKPDGKFSFRGAKLLTAELPIKSKTRLAVSKQGEFHVGYYSPQDGTITLYHEMKDPEVFPLLPKGSGLELKRVPDPEAVEFKAKLARWAPREGVYDTASALLVAVDHGDVAAIPDTTLVSRYDRYIGLARTAPAAELEKLSAIDQVNTLRLRALYPKEIAAGATAAALIAADIKADYFMLQQFVHTPVTDANVDSKQKKGSALIVANQRMGIARALTATGSSNGTWSFSLLEARDADIASATGAPADRPGPLPAAFTYLERRLSIRDARDQAKLLQPLAH